MANSGYILIEAGIDFYDTSEQTVAGIYNEITKAVNTGKQIILTGADDNGASVSPIACSVEASSGGYALKCAGYDIVVTSANKVTVTASGGDEPESPYTVIDLDGLDIYGSTGGDFADILAALNTAKPTTKPILFTNFVNDTESFECAFGTLVSDNNTEDATFYLVSSKVVLGATATTITKISYS